jgi:hypothetical protein
MFAVFDSVSTEARLVPPASPARAQYVIEIHSVRAELISYYTRAPPQSRLLWISQECER